MFNWFDSAHAEAFGAALADNYHARHAAVAGRRGNSQRQEEKVKNLIAELLIEAVNFNAANRLNIYKKAKLGNAFKWKMLDLGYDKSVVDALVKDLMLALR